MLHQHLLSYRVETSVNFHPKNKSGLESTTQPLVYKSIGLSTTTPKMIGSYMCGYRLMFSILHKDSPTFTLSPPKFHIYDNLCGYQPEYYKCKLSKGLAKCAAELVPILPKL